MRISVVIPVLNEERRIGGCIRQVRALSGDWEIIVADGGSQDCSKEVAIEAGATFVLSAPRGRGQQLRVGAEAATGDALLFLHADCSLPGIAHVRVHETLSDGRWCSGAFRVRHRIPEGTRLLPRLLLRTADWRSRRTALPYGDQALFCSREAYESCGGMPPQALMEDLEFARRLRRLGPLRRLSDSVSVSGRRFLRRPIRTAICWHSFPWLYRFGVSPDRLAGWYQR